VEWIKEVAKYHKEWIKVVRDFGEDFYAEDLVQEMYIRVNKYSSPEKIIKDGQLNKGFIWFVLRNIFVDYTKQRNRLTKVSLDDAKYLSYEEADNLQINAKNTIDLKIENEMSSWHWYDSMLFKLYKNSGMSMRDIEMETKISLTSIFHTIKDCKARLRDAVGEDYIDYKNEEYERII